MSEVVKFYPANADKNPDVVLERCMGVYSDVLVIGWDKDGALDARISLGLDDMAQVLWLLELFKAGLMAASINGDLE